MFEKLLPADLGKVDGILSVADLDYDGIVERTEGYSGADIRLVCKEAAVRPLRRLMGSSMNLMLVWLAHGGMKVKDLQLLNKERLWQLIEPITAADEQGSLIVPSINLHSIRKVC